VTRATVPEVVTEGKVETTSFPFRKRAAEPVCEIVIDHEKRFDISTSP
jgi:hypothetical protein